MEFERLLRVYAGWGMRVVFVPHDATHEEPEIEVREPEKQEEGRVLAGLSHWKAQAGLPPGLRSFVRGQI